MTPSQPEATAADSLARCHLKMLVAKSRRPWSCFDARGSFETGDANGGGYENSGTVRSLKCHVVRGRS